MMSQSDNFQTLQKNAATTSSESWMYRRAEDQITVKKNRAIKLIKVAKILSTNLR